MSIQAVVIYLVTLAGGCIPLLVGVREQMQRSLIAAATGVLLAAVFLHFLPLLSGMQSSLGDGHGWRSLWMIVLAVVVGLGLVDAILCRREGHEGIHEHEAEHAHHHATAGWAALTGLSIHSFTEGFGLAGSNHGRDLANSMYVSIVAHKLAESFSLSTIFVSAGFARTRILRLQLLYASVTPIGVLSGDALAGAIGPRCLGVLTAITCGTFLFVGLCELLPGTFHRRDQAPFHFLLVAMGVGFLLWVGGD